MFVYVSQGALRFPALCHYGCLVHEQFRELVVCRLTLEEKERIVIVTMVTMVLP